MRGPIRQSDVPTERAHTNSGTRKRRKEYGKEILQSRVGGMWYTKSHFKMGVLGNF